MRKNDEIDRATTEERAAVDRARAECVGRTGMRPTRGMLLEFLEEYRASRDKK